VYSGVLKPAFPYLIGGSVICAVLFWISAFAEKAIGCKENEYYGARG